METTNDLEFDEETEPYMVEGYLYGAPLRLGEKMCSFGHGPEGGWLTLETTAVTNQAAPTGAGSGQKEAGTGIAAVAVTSSAVPNDELGATGVSSGQKEVG